VAAQLAASEEGFSSVSKLIRLMGLSKINMFTGLLVKLIKC
jgi:hypothetical protein